MFPDWKDLTETPVAEAQLEALGFEDAAGAVASLNRIVGAWRGFGEIPDQAVQPAWYQQLRRILREVPLRDLVLRVVDRFVQNLQAESNPFELFDRNPRALQILARIACASPFLTQTLLSDPNCLAELAVGGRAADAKDREQFLDEAWRCCSVRPDRTSRLIELRRFQRRELLRIGMCDAFGLMDLRFITLQLSLLADAMVQCCLNLAAAECGTTADVLSIIALGKLGGEELNYSSDIDLLILTDRSSDDAARVARLTIDALTDDLSPGFLYRVDLRLRPWGDAGPLVSTTESYSSYVLQDAAAWEKQALLKARPIAGSFEIGQRFLKSVRPLIFHGAADQVRASIVEMKNRIEARLRMRGKLHSEVKLGAGSIRDIEFLVQSLQLIHGQDEPRVLSANTLDALVRLAEFGLISAMWYRQLRTGYVFLRTLEHSLQLLHNQQTHELPDDPFQREWLANRLDYPDTDTLLSRYGEHRTAVRGIFESCLLAEQRAGNALAGLQSAESRSSELFSNSLVTSEELTQHQALVRRLLNEITESRSCRVFLGGEDTAGLRKLIVTGRDFSGWLSTICGLLSICRLDIRNGDAVTGEGQNSFGDRCVAGRFIACFQVRSASGSVPDNESVAVTSEVLEAELIRLGTASRGERIEDVRAELITRFCDAVPARATSRAGWDESRLDVELSPVPGTVLTEVNITGDDSWGFLFELFSALSLSRFRVLRAIIREDGHRVHDTLYVRERNGLPVASEERRQELKLAATLIKQFTHWLPGANDPHRALTRFRELVARLQPATAWARNMQSLQRPGVLHAVARVLGISQYLWETFLRSRHEQLFPLLGNAEELALRECRETLALELDDLTATTSGKRAWERLNEFKDRHLFRIDMRNVLGHCRPFGAFSEELTELAEIVVTAAMQLAWNDAVSLFGTPQADDGVSPVRWMVAGLGKFGGVEMGFASDLELMLVYEKSGFTNGPNRVGNGEFFEAMINSVAAGIVAPQDGIFHVDLRIRPFGQAGSAAVLLAELVQYYQPGGSAWPYERQSLVRFRPVAGDSGFCHEVQQAVHNAVYCPGQFDFVAMKAMRERQIRQLVRGGSVNAKLSDGGIVDFEYAVQAIQLTWGWRHAELRQVNTLRVLDEAVRLGLVPEEIHQSLRNAYVFLRELIDCLRMVRGNARDLNVPAEGTEAWMQLCRRMEVIHDSDIPLSSLEQQLQTVRRFSKGIEELCLSIDSEGNTIPS